MPGHHGLESSKRRDITRRQDNGFSAPEQRAINDGYSSKVEVLKRGLEVRSRYGVGSP